MNKKNMPVIIMLVAGAVTCFITFIRQYSILNKLVSLFVVMVLFYTLGNILRGIITYFEKQNEKKNKEDGEVIEKEAEKTEEGKVIQEASKESSKEIPKDNTKDSKE